MASPARFIRRAVLVARAAVEATEDAGGDRLRTETRQRHEAEAFREQVALQHHEVAPWLDRNTEPAPGECVQAVERRQRVEVMTHFRSEPDFMCLAYAAPCMRVEGLHQRVRRQVDPGRVQPMRRALPQAGNVHR